jgi:hypothetical protein
MSQRGILAKDLSRCPPGERRSRDLMPMRALADPVLADDAGRAGV